jgi:hypothetical protein
VNGHPARAVAGGATGSVVSGLTGNSRRRLPRPMLVLAAAALAAVALVISSCAAQDTSPPGPAAYNAGLWPARPRVQLSYDVAPDLHSATGTESVVFTPDARTCQLVFRAWPNNPTMAKTGSSLAVTKAMVEGKQVEPTVTAAGAPSGAPGTLIEVPLQHCLNAGQSVQANLDFRLALGLDADERVGFSPDTNTAWFGSGFPLLAWIRGQGWARDPAVNINGETAASEDFMLSDLSVTAPNDDQVIGTGTAAGEAPGPTPGTTTHRFTAPAVRDVTVEVGHYNVLNRDIGAVHLHLATPKSGTKADPAMWADQLNDVVTSLTELFGPFPYPDLWVAITPGQSDGTEFPTALQMSDARSKDLPALIAHEVSHQWFYSLVGNNQAEHPWMDEALATFGEANAGGDAHDYRYDDTPRRVVGLMGRPMSYWADNGGFERYTQGVYNQGAAVLLEARRRVGTDRFDTALRNYIVANAHRVATPDDFARAFADQPQVLDLLREAGALPGSPQGSGREQEEDNNDDNGGRTQHISWPTPGIADSPGQRGSALGAIPR